MGCELLRIDSGLWEVKLLLGNQMVFHCSELDCKTARRELVFDCLVDGTSGSHEFVDAGSLFGGL